MASTSFLKVALLCSLVTGVYPVSARADDEVDDDNNVEVGSKVRVTVPSLAHGPLIGTVKAIDRAILTLETADGKRQTVQQADVTRLEVAFRSRGHATVPGVLAGVVIGATVGALWARDDDRCELNTVSSTWACFSRGAKAGVLGVVGGALGTGVGALVAPLRWHEGRVVQMKISRVRRGMGVTLALAF